MPVEKDDSNLSVCPADFYSAGGECNFVSLALMCLLFTVPSIFVDVT